MDFPATTCEELGLATDGDVFEAQQIVVLKPQPILDYVHRLYGLDPSLFSNLLFCRQGTKQIRCLQRPTALFPSPDLDRVGLDFLRIDMVTPRLSTPAALTWGSEATTNAIDLDRSLCKAYLRRQPLELDASDLQHCTGRGFMIVRHRGHGLGLGFLESSDPGDQRFGHLRSLYPKAYAQEVQSISPFGNAHE